MDIEELASLGAFRAAEPVRREITFTLDDGEERTGTIFVMRLALGEYERLSMVDTDKHSRSASLIAETVRLGEDGKQRIPVAKAERLHPSIAQAMIEAFNEVNAAKK